MFATPSSMAKFVNYRKRNASLPPGCKDLIDVLDPKAKKTAFASLTPAQKSEMEKLQRDIDRAQSRFETTVGYLCDLERLVFRIYQCDALSASLQMGPLDNLLFHLDHHQIPSFERSLEASVWAEEGSDLYVKTTAFLAARGLKSPPGPEVHGNFWAPGIPVTLVRNLVPIPPDAPSFARLAEDFFREVCQLNENSPVHFQIDEQIIPPEDNPPA